MDVNANPYAAPWRISDEWTGAQRERYLNDQARAVARLRPRELVALCARILRRAKQLPDAEPLALRVTRVALVAVQSVPYRDDPAGQEYYQGPVYTLRHGGDCEDKAVLLVVVLLMFAIAARVVWMDLARQGQRYNHVSVQAGPGNQWAETIIPGAELGEEPLAASERLGHGGRLQSIPYQPYVRGGAMKAAGWPGVKPSGALGDQQLLTCPNDTRGWCLQAWRWGDAGTSMGPPGWLHWVQYGKAAAWLARAVALSTEAEETRLNAAGWNAQRDQTEAVYQALAEFFQALNLCPDACPPYVVEWEAEVGKHVRPGWLTGFKPDAYNASGLPRLHTAVLDTMRRVQPDRFSAEVQLRCAIDSAGVARFLCLQPSMVPASPPPAANMQGVNCGMKWYTPEGAYTWDSLSWTVYTGAFGWVGHVINPPLRPFFQLARRIVRRIQAAGTLPQLLNACHKYQLLVNMNTVQQLQHEHPEIIRPEQIRDFEAARAEADARGTPRGDIGDDVYKIAFTVAAALPTPANLIVGAGLAVGEWLTRTFPVPVLLGPDAFDSFGQRTPRFVGVSISGDVTRNDPPTQEVPAAPTGSAAPGGATLTLPPLVFLPGLLPVLQATQGGTAKGGSALATGDGGASPPTTAAQGMTDNEKTALVVGGLGVAGLLAYALTRRGR